MRDFEYALQLCEQKASYDKTWAEFNTNFNDAQHDLKKIRGPNMHQSGYHHVNCIVSQIRTDVNE